jgi:hypothetical protein
VYTTGEAIELQPPAEVLAVGQLFAVSLSINVFAVVRVDGEDVSATVIVTVVALAGTVNLYQASALIPQLPVPVTLLVLALFKVPAVGEHV